MLFAQIGMDSGLVAAIPRAIANGFATITAVAGLTLGVTALGAGIFKRVWERLIVYPAFGAFTCFAMYLMWWWSISAVPTDPFYLIAVVGGMVSGVLALLRVRTWRLI
jgi:hypothetical protein